MKYLYTLANASHKDISLQDHQFRLQDIDVLLQQISKDVNDQLNNKYETSELRKSREKCTLIIWVSFIVGCCLVFPPFLLLLAIAYGIYKLCFTKKSTRKKFYDD